MKKYLFLAFLFLLPLTYALAFDPLFDEPLNYDADDTPFSITTGDFNEDGHADLATANRVSDNTSILLGAGDGTFAPSVNYATGRYPTAVTTGDFNEDGHADLATANKTADNVSILLGAGDGTFSSAVNYAAADGPRFVTIGDFNEDGHADLAVANHYSSNVSILLGAGDGTFASAVNYSANNSPSSVATGDFDEDGHTDVAVTNETSNDVSIFLGAGDGTFASAVNYGTNNGFNPWSVITGDFDEDGHIDLATANYAFDPVSILLGVGDGTFALAVNYTAAGTARVSVTTGDFDEDGHADLAVANWLSHDISVLLGMGDGTFIYTMNYTAGTSPATVITGDFDEDGHTDLATANSGGASQGNVSILINLTEDPVATMLQSYWCSCTEDGIEVFWSLSEAGTFMEFFVYREREGSGKFQPIETEIFRSGELSYRLVDKSCEPGSFYRYRVDVTDEDGTRTLFVTERVMIDTPKLAFGQNYPNPFNLSTTIHYNIPAVSYVTLDIFDVTGRRIARLADSVHRAGMHTKEWSGRNEDGIMVSNGIYFYRLTTGKKSITKKMLKIR
jgi:hypothetical protein